MLNFKKHCIGSLLALSIGTLAAGAYADTPSAPPSAPSSTSAAPMHHGAPTPEMRAKFAAKMEKRQEALHAKLKLTAAQEPAWKTFVEQTKPPQRDANKQHHEDRAAWAKLTTPERMEKFLARMQTREQFLTARLNAVKTFYAVLTPTQQKTFDAAYAHGPFGGHHHRHRHHGAHDKAALVAPAQ
jgi:protein CpxP